jgi:deoxyribodipyrimidine photolyase-related protein
MEDFVILPNQLFSINYLNKKKYKYIIWEHPHYFESYKYNKKKILMHKASMNYYYDYLKKNKFKCEYVDINQKLTIKDYTIFDPIDKIKLSSKCTIIESPNFLLNKEIYATYREKTDKFFFNAFYMWSKKLLNIMPDIKSQDKLNRKKLPNNIQIPKVASNAKDKKYIDSNISYVNKNFKNNYGTTDNFIFPISHKTAKLFFKNFIDNKLKNYGDYQDSINKEEEFLFHSLLSSSINIGLLNPIDLIKIIIKTNAPLNSKEGFIRQLFWREYQRYCFIYCDFDKNYFGNNIKLSNKWYNGTLNIEPVDVSIKNAFNNGYLHHIERLMIVGNFMNLSKIDPKEGFKWFMEFSCDSYEWVMFQNVLDMVFFVTGGATTRRPYMSSSNYILKMSNYKKDVWCDIWDKKYKDFINTNKKKLHKFRYYYKV